MDTFDSVDIWRTPQWIRQSQILLDSFEHFLNRPLLPRGSDASREAKMLFHAPFVVVSHGLQDDPILNYGNQTALDLWQMNVEQLTSTPSRLTAEPDQRDERAIMLRAAEESGYFENYRGVRISSTGRRFRIDQAIVWRLLDKGRQAGQAATFSDWQFLDEA